MEYLELSKFVTSVAVAFATILLRFVFKALNRNSEKIKIRSASVELIDRMLNEREWKKSENRIVIEEAFEHLYSKPLRFDEIRALVYSETPSAAFKTYLKYRPAVELNEKKSKFRFRDGRRPYWVFTNRKFKIPKAITKGVFFYALLAGPASVAMTWLMNAGVNTLELWDLVIFWFLDGLLWLMGAIFLIEGFKYQDSEKELIRDLGDKFEINK
ncbi:hypothetical protein [Salinivibrio kushneri]|uniref:hypothetical protein n=1 Tax=Salinivibrio kushneri TaxID=1908198 RepID=UPI0022B2DFFE|nr:hypothetical protein [Salinivibrio kushneri]WBA12609.1 hypothetical protein O4546_05225 [Salinivibrio kushneri]